MSGWINAILFYRDSSYTDENAVRSLLHIKDSGNPPDFVSDSNDSGKSIDVPIYIPFETRSIQKQEYNVDSYFTQVHSTKQPFCIKWQEYKIAKFLS